MFIIRLGAILMFVAGLAAASLALLNTQTAPIIAENKARMQAEARSEVVRSLGVSSYDEVITEDNFTYYRCLDDSGSVIGYTTLALGKGYSSTIETVSGFSADYKVAGLKITFQQETPGLGTKAEEVKKGDTEPWFLHQFKQLDAFTLAVKKDRGQIDAITGATITARAIANSIRDAAIQIQEAELKNPAPVVSEESSEITTADGEGE
jgi:H+/Na+-translocating ferredoxin:NAD+ oxidoreductase subunit G